MGGFPPGWSKTISQLLADSPSAPSEQIEWARCYEREQLRPWARFPQHGDIYESLRDYKVSYLTHWRAPYTGGGDGLLPKGTRVQVTVFDFGLEPIGVYATPIDSRRIELILVPEADRGAGGYNGYSLYFSTSDLNRDFHLIVAADAP